MLVLTHLSTRYSGGEVQSEARAVFAPTEVPRDFDAVEVPFPERGPARLVRWSNRPPAVPTGAGAGGAEGAGERAQGEEAGGGAGVRTPQDTETVASSIIP